MPFTLTFCCKGLLSSNTTQPVNFVVCVQIMTKTAHTQQLAHTTHTQNSYKTLLGNPSGFHDLIYFLQTEFLLKYC